MAAKEYVVVTAAIFEGWIPIRIYPQGAELMVDWCYLGDRRFEEPFFSLTVQALLKHPFCGIFRHQTPISVLEELYREAPAMEPDGFIFHMTHCGSTLVTQALTAAGHLALSEPDPLEPLLRRNRMTAWISDEQRIAWVRWLVSALGRARSDAKQRYFIKLDAFAVTQIPLLRRAFPDVPWVFLYRDPIEVLASIDGMPGCAVPGYLDPACVGLDYQGVMAISPDEYLARLLAAYCESTLRWHAEGRGMLMNFRELPEAIWTSMARRFGAQFSESEIARMRQRTSFNAKRPEEKFAEDNESKRRAGAARWQQLAAKWLDPLYENLESARLSDAGRSPAAAFGRAAEQRF